jgi:hypothetical protein
MHQVTAFDTAGFATFKGESNHGESASRIWGLCKKHPLESDESGIPWDLGEIMWNPSPVLQPILGHIGPYLRMASNSNLDSRRAIWPPSWDGWGWSCSAGPFQIFRPNVSNIVKSIQKLFKSRESRTTKWLTGDNGTTVVGPHLLFGTLRKEESTLPRSQRQWRKLTAKASAYVCRLTMQSGQSTTLAPTPLALPGPTSAWGSQSCCTWHFDVSRKVACWNSWNCPTSGLSWQNLQALNWDASCIWGLLPSWNHCSCVSVCTFDRKNTSQRLARQ